MKNKLENFIVDMRTYIEAKNVKLLRGEVHPDLEHETDAKVIIEYLIEKGKLTQEEHFYMAKFRVQDHLAKIEKYFLHAHTCMWLYCKKDDDMYMLASPNVRKQLAIDYGVEFNSRTNRHIPYFALKRDEVIYIDTSKPPTYDVAEPSHLWMKYGYQSMWAIPFYLDGEPVGSVGFNFTNDVGRLPIAAELAFINEELHQLEDEFKIILSSYEKFKNKKTKEIT